MLSSTYYWPFFLNLFLISCSRTLFAFEWCYRWIKCGVLELEISRGFGEKYKRTLEIISSYQFGNFYLCLQLSLWSSVNKSRAVVYLELIVYFKFVIIQVSADARNDSSIAFPQYSNIRIFSSKLNDRPYSISAFYANIVEVNKILGCYCFNMH